MVSTQQLISTGDLKMREENGLCLETRKGERAGRGTALGPAASLVAAVAREAAERRTDLAADIFLVVEILEALCIRVGVLRFPRVLQFSADVFCVYTRTETHMVLAHLPDTWSFSSTWLI